MLNSGYIYCDTVRPLHEGVTVLDFYANNYDDFTVSEWRQRIIDGQIYRNARKAGEHDILHTGDALEYRRPPWIEPEVPTQIDILLEEEHFCVFHKPSGLPVLPGGGYLEHTLLNIVRHRFDYRLSPIHRLGRGTSGAILFTRTPEAAAAISAAMREHRIRKVYLGLADGNPPMDEFSVDAPIGLVPHPRLHRIHAFAPGGKPSTSSMRVVERRPDGTALIEITIPTGRPHQIRIHLAYAGFPLKGDRLYEIGGLPRYFDRIEDNAVPGDCGYLLHSWRIVFPHPVSNENVHVEAPPPAELRPVKENVHVEAPPPAKLHPVL